MVQDGIDQGAAFVARSRVDDQPSRFVYCDQVIIFVENVEGDRLRFDICWFGCWNGNADEVVRVEPMRWLGGVLVHQDIALPYPALDFGAGVLGEMSGEIAV